MAYEIVLSKRFQNKLVSLLEYLEKEWGKKVADDFLTKVDLRISSLQRHPFIGTLTTITHVRSIHISRHNRMYYKVVDNTVTILNLYDTRTKNYS